MAKKECVICGSGIGMLASRVQCKDGLICANCFKKMGFSTLDGNLLLEVKNKTVREIQCMSTVDDGTVSIREKVENLIVSDPGINLKEKEVCFFKAEAFIGKQRRRTTSYSSTGLHSNLHVMKGVNLRIGNTKYTPNQETYWEKIPCRFFVTSNRFIALATKGGFEFNANKLLDMELHKDGVILYAGKETHVLFMNKEDAKQYKTLWEMLNKAHEEGLEVSDFMN